MQWVLTQTPIKLRAVLNKKKNATTSGQKSQRLKENVSIHLPLTQNYYRDDDSPSDSSEFFSGTQVHWNMA